MPYRRNFRRRRYGRTPRRYVRRRGRLSHYRSRYKRRTRVPWAMPSSAQASKVVKMTFTENKTMVTSTSSDTMTDILFRLNSAYDPDWQVGGHQPRGHDRMSTLYKYYDVLWTGWKCTFSLADVDNADREIVCCVAVEGNAPNTAGCQVRQEEPGIIKRTLQARSARPVVIRGQTYPKRYLESINRAQYAGTGENPGWACDLRIGVGRPAGGEASSVYLRVDLVMIVRYADPIADTVLD